MRALICLTVLIIAGCSTGANDLQPVEGETPATSSAVPTEALKVAATVRPTLTAIPSALVATSTADPPTALPTSSPTARPTPTLLPTETATATPWPTLPPDEAADKVLALLADNQNPDCLLPCWWGATPGRTRWSDVFPYLQSFSLQAYAYPQDSLYVIAYPLPSDISGLEEFHIGYTYNASNTITSIDVPSINIEGYDAKTMITLYGVPDEVWLTTLDAPREGVLPFQLIIVYQQQGISFRYYVDATGTGETVTACFEPGIELERPDLFPAGPRIYVWEPGQHKDIEEISPIPREIYYPLAEKTDLTPQTLYEKFTSPDEPPCIDTPADLWRD